MRITDLLKKSGIALGVKVADKSEAIDKLVSLHEKWEDALSFVQRSSLTMPLIRT